MNHDDIVHSHYQTAQVTAANNQRQHLNRQAHAQGDAESRAFYAERAKQQADQALQQEQAEHAITQSALVRLLSEHIGMQKTLRHLAERWATHEGKPAEELRLSLLQDAKVRAQGVRDKQGNQRLLREEMEVYRNGERVLPKPGA